MFFVENLPMDGVKQAPSDGKDQFKIHQMKPSEFPGFPVPLDLSVGDDLKEMMKFGEKGAPPGFPEVLEAMRQEHNQEIEFDYDGPDIPIGELPSVFLDAMDPLDLASPGGEEEEVLRQKAFMASLENLKQESLSSMDKANIRCEGSSSCGDARAQSSQK
ncbi:uncharacterized protein LOC143032145 [Oratosquilla oratoria]|uniref:uncharacterized protein LOC143032145 n=1 Tax=Oratosquilla oratoria TaxID=337810 RepID=UPI003F75C41C